ncbi:MAG: S-layer protein domain-containing protein, partial [Candidatus Methanoperedens sp.]|nr:S-layer protein domain-containing protein [Candidatus Methanoperedens sp.]
MSKKLIAVALVMLMLLVLPASATIKATSVEIRGQVSANNTSQDNNSVTVGFWNATNFAGFWYDIKDDLKTESLEILASTANASGNTIGGTDRTIDGDMLWYNTTKAAKTLKVKSNSKNNSEIDGAFTNGQYDVVGWMAQPYIAIKSNANKLAKLIIEQGNATAEKKTLTVGETWDIGEGWTLAAQSIDAKASPRQVWLVLSKDGVKKDDKVIGQGNAYVYVEKSFAGETDVPLFVTYVDSVFAGATTDMVQLRYTWAIGTSVTEPKTNDKFGSMEVVTADATNVQLKNKDTAITLTRDGTINVMGDVKFKVADSDTIRFYPMVTRTTPGIHEVRGTVVTGITAGQSWDATSFAGFWYDLKDNLKTETLNITVASGTRTIAADALWYNTSKAEKTLKVQSNNVSNNEINTAFSSTGKYSVVGWMAQPYIAIKNNANKLAKLIIEQGNATAEKKTLTVGETWDIGEGWTLAAQSIDAKASPRQVWLVLSKDGVKKDDKVIGQGTSYVYIEKSFAGETDVPQFVTY